MLAREVYFRVTVHQNKRKIYESAIFQKVVTNLIDDDDDVARVSFDAFSEQQQHQQQEQEMHSQKQSFSSE